MRWMIVLVLSFVAVPAAAQTSPTTYVSAAFIGEFSHLSGVDTDDEFPSISGISVPPRGGETVGFSLAVGRSLGERWGVELEYGRGSTIRDRRTVRTSPIFDIGIPLPAPDTLPLFDFEVRSEQQHTTLSTVGWFRQEIGGRVDLVFLAGASFSRSEREQEVTIDERWFRAIPPTIPTRLLAPFPTDIESVSYGVGPVVGTETLIHLGDHASVTAGIRLHGIPGGWLIRPAAGVRWAF